MIKTLHIENYALIDRLDMNFHEGFSVITGETGAGKSIILGAIGLLLGQRADMKSIKNGEQRCVVEAVFDVDSYGLDPFFDDNDLDFDGKECVVRRELTASGKSRAFINDTPVALTLMKELGDRLIDIHSQHQNLLLSKEDFQLQVLDILAGDEREREECREAFRIYTDHRRQLEDAIEANRKSRDDEDFVRFQYDQLKSANLEEGEEEELEKESELLSHSEEIKQGLYSAARMLSGDDDRDAVQQVRESYNMLRGLVNVYGEAEPLAERLESCYIELKDIVDELESKADEVDYDPQRLEIVNARLDLINGLMKKHRVDSVTELLKIQKELGQRLERCEHGDEIIEELSRKTEECRMKMEEKADVLSRMRHGVAKKVEEEMKNQLMPLGMPNVRFEVALSDKEGTDATGKDKVVFLFTANRNGQMQNVAQVASGGEIARVMLSLKSLIARKVKMPTIIFDEIDTGVSGAVAEKMARIMSDMGGHGRQVISITHLPQIAALGKHHYKVYKEDKNDVTVSHIVEVSGEKRIEEVAHMLSGEVMSEAAMNNARALCCETEGAGKNII